MDKQTESLIETISNGSYKLGQIVQLEHTAVEYFEKAGKYFSEGKDDLANVFREESRKMVQTAKLMRNSYENQEQKSSNRSWKILNEKIENIFGEE